MQERMRVDKVARRNGLSWASVARRRKYKQSLPVTLDQQIDAWEAKEDARIDVKLIDRARQKKEQRHRRKGWVYCIGNTGLGWYKIGMTCQRSPVNRIETIASGVPFVLDFRRLWPTEDAYVVESRLHRRFAKLRVKNEWFKMPESEIERVCRTAMFMSLDGDRPITSQALLSEDNQMDNILLETTGTGETTEIPDSAQIPTESI